MKKKFVFAYSQIHFDFRQAELESICSLYNISLCNGSFSFSEQQHIYEFEFLSTDCVKKILSRSVLIKYVIEWISNAKSYDQLCTDIVNKRNETVKYDFIDQSFAIRLQTVGKGRNRDAVQNKIADIGKALGFNEAPVNLETPCNTFYVIEEFSNDSLQNLYFGKLIGCGQGQLKNRYSLTERCYIGNTTMDPELSFLQANIAKADTGSLILDPFCGTGGLLLAAAHFGASVIGSEINYQIARAIGRSSRAGVKYIGADESVAGNFRQYGTESLFLGLVIADASQHKIWRSATNSNSIPVFDALISDPPYGVREKGQKVCMKQKRESWIISESQYENHYPEKAKYSISSTFLDLLNLASKLLVIGGRLIFWFPVFGDEYSEEVLPKHNAMKLIYNCEQSLSRRYSRRLLAYEKISDFKNGEKAYLEKDCYKEMTFRQRIFIKN